jgi:hypothetical protein
MITGAVERLGGTTLSMASEMKRMLPAPAERFLMGMSGAKL